VIDYWGCEIIAEYNVITDVARDLNGSVALTNHICKIECQAHGVPCRQFQSGLIQSCFSLKNSV
jgi:hypothetical protein